MSPSVREESDDQRIELGTNISWPHIIVGLSLLIVPAVIALVALIGSSSTHSPAPVRTERAALPMDQIDNRPAREEAVEPPMAIVETLPQPRVVDFVALQARKPDREVLPTPRAVAAKPANVKPPVAVVAAPAPVVTPPVVATIHTSALKRRFWNYEDVLRARLLDEVAELDIEKEKGTTKNLLPKKDTGNKLTTRSPSLVNHEPFLAQVVQRADLKGLPFLDVEKCQAPEDQAKVIQNLSTDGRRSARITRSRTTRASESSQSEGHIRETEVATYLDQKLTGSEWSEEAGLRLLVQMFQIEREMVRMQVIKKLAASKAKNAGALLAQRAVFDLSPQVREAAIEALRKRSAADCRQILVEAMRYPWPTAADHAAEALVALNDREAIPDLKGLLEKPDPRAPFQNKEKKWVAAELVRVNHLGNCVLCHAPAASRYDPVRGVVPERGEPIPEVYYDSPTGNFVRADVTYLRQDFSVMQPVAEPKKWPSIQRFDYLVRERELSDDEVKRLEATRDVANAVKTYPQREAVLWAIRELTAQEPSAK